MSDPSAAAASAAAPAASDAAPKPAKAPKSKPAKAAKDAGSGSAGKRIEEFAVPEYVPYRIDLFDRLYAEQQAAIEAKAAENRAITITLPTGREVPGVAWKTTPLDVAAIIAKSLAESACVALVNGEQWDLTRPLEDSCSLELLRFDHELGLRTFLHSSAHVLGEAMERVFNCNLCVGPPLPKDQGFFYEAQMGDRTVTAEDYADLHNVVKKIVQDKQVFQRLAVPKDVALEIFRHNPYKSELLAKKVPEGSICTIYRCGDLVDPCSGPHLPNTGRVKAFQVMKNSSSYWMGDPTRDTLQRIYATAFPSKKELDEYLEFLEQAKERDHRLIGVRQELYFFDSLSPGSCFFFPDGAKIYNRLIEFLRKEYRRRGYQEVMTPNIFDVRLWETSGHWQNYNEHMFSFKVEDTIFALKPMNCPSHCAMYKQRPRSYRELPLRWADFGVLHRNEFSGALSGLTRVRRFQQDDAHIFCPPDKLADEIHNVLDFVQHVYKIFGFTLELALSTRPEKFLGQIETWDRAEAALREALERLGKPWVLNPGDGAFYGPKIDMRIEDALRRKWQTATLQLDFQLPERFDLQFVAQDGSLVRPVIIHRAIYGSLERFIAILTEHVAGKWPLWLSPRQVRVVPVSERFCDYAYEVRNRVFEAGFDAEVDDSDNTVSKKVRTAQIEHWNYILVVGQEELDHQTVNVRTRDNVVHGECKVEELVERLNHAREAFE